jgi:hypothetical protein
VALVVVTFSPNEKYRYSLKEGMSGWDVWACQIALNSTLGKPGLVEDGVFGPITTAAVRIIQGHLGITVDGICGPQTQASICVRECNAVHHVVPTGLLKGACLGESGGIIPATSVLYPNGSRDYGPLQDNLNLPSQAALKEAFDIVLQAREVAGRIKSTYVSFHGQPGAQSQETAWRLAVLNYNWPAAANQIAAGHADTWIYVESGTGIKRRLSDRAPWVEAYGIPGVTTGLDWTHFYVASKVAYVTSWTVS